MSTLPTESSESPSNLKFDIFAWIITALALPLLLLAKLLPALFAGLLVYELVRRLARRMPLPKQLISIRGARALSLILLVLSILGLLVCAILGIISFVESDSGNISNIIQRMAEVAQNARSQVPPWLANYIPQGADALQNAVSVWLRSHVTTVQQAGALLGYGFVYAFIGMVIGALISLSLQDDDREYTPFVRSLLDRAQHLSDAFGTVVFAQVRISAINTTITAIYLLFVLPSLGADLPLGKTMVALTFLVGLLPVIGNLISNTIIVTVSLSVSLPIALLSLLYLILIHKLEYFINARIIGSKIHAKVWEMLIAMLVMEAIFGMSGVIAAPIFYAYIKRELHAKDLI